MEKAELPERRDAFTVDVEYAAAASESVVRGDGNAGVVVTYHDGITVVTNGAIVVLPQLGWRFSCQWTHDPLPEQFKSGSTIHLAFQHLQAIYMTFDNTITPATADCLTYSRSISFHPRSYAPKFC